MLRRGFLHAVTMAAAAVVKFFNSEPRETEELGVRVSPGREVAIIELEQAVIRYDPVMAEIQLDIPSEDESVVAVFDGESFSPHPYSPLPVVFTGCRLIAWEDMREGCRYLRVGGPSDMSEFFFRGWQDKSGGVAICEPFFSSTNSA